MQKLLQWRKTSQPVTEGKLIHYTPDRTGCYVYARVKDDTTVLVILNGNDKEEELNMYRFREVTGNASTGKDIISGRVIDISNELSIPAKGIYILEL